MKRSQRIELEIERRLIAEFEKTDLDRERERSRSLRRTFEQEKSALMRELDSARAQATERVIQNDRERTLALQAFLSNSIGAKTDAYLQEIAQISVNTRTIAEVSTSLYEKLKSLDQQLAISTASDAPPVRRSPRRPPA